MIFSESRLMASDGDHYKHPDFNEFCNYEKPPCPFTSRPSHGTVVYSKEEYLPTFPKIHNTKDIEITLIRTKKFPTLLIVAVYKPPSTSRKNLEAAIMSVLPASDCDDVIILGDFNIDLAKQQQVKLPTSYHQCLTQPTTIHGTRIDHIYTNLAHEKYTFGTVPAYWSDHAIIWLAMKI